MNIQPDRMTQSQLSLSYTQALLKGHEMGRARFISQNGKQAYEAKRQRLKRIIEQKVQRLENARKVNPATQWQDLQTMLNEPAMRRRFIRKHSESYELFMTQLAIQVNQEKERQ